MGVPDNHETTPEVIWLNDVHPGGQNSDMVECSVTGSTASTFGAHNMPDPGWSLSEVLRTRQSMVVDCSDLIADYAPRAWDELPTRAMVIPVTLNSEEGLPGAVLILGLSPRLTFDDTYAVFTEDLRFQLASYLSSVKLYTSDQKRLGDLTTLDKAKSLLFANVSHELIAPISLIAGPLDDFIADIADDAKREPLVMARRNV